MKIIVSLFLFFLVLVSGCTASTETPTGEQTDNQPSSDPIVTPPSDNSTTDDPVIEEPIAEEPVIDDSPQDPVPDQPAEEPPTEEPPVEDPPDEEPVDETPTEEPPTEPPAEDPTEEPPAEESPPQPPTEDPPAEPPMEEPSEFTIERTNTGYSPSTLTISVGDTVIFLNKSNSQNWPASDRHPTHTNYPGSGITKCGSSTTIFDACKELASGESYSFTFNEIGTWNYHDHLQPGKTGTIIVE